MNEREYVNGMGSAFVTRGGGGPRGGASRAGDGASAVEVSRGGGGGGGLDPPFPNVSRNLLSAQRRTGVAGPQLGVGDVVDGYVITGVSGRPGAFGRVWIAHAEDNPGFRVAIKEMLKEDEDRREELRDTFRLVRDIKNDHIADPVRIAKKDGRLFTIMRFAEGKSLDKWAAERGGAIPAPLAFEIARQIADALDAAHRKRVMHLDIKPDNVMVEDLPGGGVHVQVLDFGLAKRIDPEGEALRGRGTGEYISPEMWTGDPRPDGRSDQYSLACVLYWMLSGSTPFRKAFAAAWRQLRRERPDVPEDALRKPWSVREDEVGRQVVAVAAARPLARLDRGRNAELLRALDKNRERRFKTCSAMVNAIRRGPSKAWRLFAAVAALMALGGASLLVWGHLETERQRKIKEVWDQVRELGGMSGIAALRSRAEGGDPDAAFELAQRLASGRNVQKDDVEAFRWFTRAGELGSAEAMFEAGDRLERGIGTRRDATAAAGWFRRAADAGSPKGAGAFAACLWDGRGAGRDPVAAREMAQRGLDAGIPSAQLVAGLALVEGIGPEHNPQRGATLVRSAAEAGDARAQFALSGLLSRGAGVRADEHEAARWSLRAAEQGLPEAALDMGERYAAGRGVMANARESRRWFDRAADTDPNAAAARRKDAAAAETARRKAAAEAAAGRAAAEAEAKADAADPARPLRRRAEAGEAFAAFELAKRLDDGIGVRKDSAEAVRWWKTLAEKEDVDDADRGRREEAWGRYGMHLLEGTGVRRDVAAAIPWLAKFVDATEDEYGVRRMTGILASGNAAPEQTPAWTGRERGMRRGAACLAVARAFEAGDGIARDLRKAESWYEKGSSDSDECRDRLLRLRATRTADDPEELYAQGYRYIVGDGVAKDARKAAELFRKAADKGHAASMFNLGVCYEQGAGVPKNLGTAASLYRQAAEKGMMNAQYNYAVFLLEGRGVRKDRNAAVAWFRKAAAQGHDGAAKALRQLGQ